MNIETLVNRQHNYFLSGKTLSVDARITALRKLKQSILEHEQDINQALMSDLGKSSSETYMCETGMTLAELSYTISHLRRWARPHRVLTPLAQFHASSFTVNNPYGVVLVMSPWNYPFMLAMEPLAGAIAGGNCCVVKPSAYSPATSAVIKTILNDCFPEDYIAVVEGGRAENQSLLDQKFDYIFFTGGVKVGKEVMLHAARNLTPVTLELGGKSPCIVDASANIDLSARRIAFGKLLNCGQTCVAPDYVLVDKTVEEQLIERMQYYIKKMMGQPALENKEYVHMINRKHFDRVMGLISQDKVVCGGKGNPESLRIEPTLLRNVTEEDPVMQEEIFGPVLPILSFNSIDEAIAMIRHRPHPLACYLFSQDKRVQKRFLNEVSFGGGCINDTIIHLATSAMGFGGVGGSGMGSYHGKKSFETFTHSKSIVKKYTWIDMPIRYMPYSKMKDKMLRFFLK